jgi:hypothetical protein
VAIHQFFDQRLGGNKLKIDWFVAHVTRSAL